MLHFDWYSVYEVGQRICRSFVQDRVYLAGDSVHTHSPFVPFRLFLFPDASYGPATTY